jgi:quercetin dioxygenase-like cupin family protein
MQLSDIPFQITDWELIPATVHSGTQGVAQWRTKNHGPIRVRMVDYSPGYVADHWCEKGHILLCLEGELYTELKDGRTVRIGPGMTYEVADGAQPHRSLSPRGAKLFIVD